MFFVCRVAAHHLANQQIHMKVIIHIIRNFRIARVKVIIVACAMLTVLFKIII